MNASGSRFQPGLSHLPAPGAKFPWWRVGRRTRFLLHLSPGFPGAALLAVAAGAVNLAVGPAVGSPPLAPAPVVAGTRNWVRESPMPVARAYLAAVLGPDSKIYAIGGNDASGKPRNDVEVYDPSTGAWTGRAPVPGTGGRLAAVTASDKIYVMGGDGARGRPVNRVEAYDVGTNQWTQRAAMPIACSAMAAVLGQDGKIYVIGGRDGVGAVVNSVEAYNPQTNTWGSRRPMPTARAGLAALSSNGGVTVFGGVDTAGKALRVVEEYVPQTNTWNRWPPLPSARSGMAVVSWSDVPKMYVLGGAGSKGVAMHSVQALTPYPRPIWTGSPPLVTARRGLAAVVGPAGSGQSVYAIGGADATGRVLNSVEMYVATAGWTSRAPLPAGRYLPAAVSANGKIYVIGGSNSPDGSGSTSVKTVDAYDPATNTWQSRAPMPIAGRGPIAAVVAGQVYVFARRTVEVYDPRADTWSIKGVLPPGVTVSAAVTGAAGEVYVVGSTDPTTVESYDTRTRLWARRPAKPRVQLGGAVISDSHGNFYVAAGVTYRLNDVVSIEVYDPRTKVWRYRAGIPTVRFYPAAANGPGGRIYVLGGQYQGRTLDDVESYDPRTNTWQIESSLPGPRWELAAVQGPDGQIYAIGGMDNRGVLSTVDAYQP